MQYTLPARNVPVNDELRDLIDRRLLPLERVPGDFRFVDSTRSTMPGRHRLQCHMTLRAGEVVWDLHGRSFPDWRETLPAAWRRE